MSQALFLNKSALPDLSRLELLNGTNYKCWSQKPLIFFEQLEVDSVLFNNAPIVPIAGDDVSAEAFAKATSDLHAYEKINKFVCGHILSQCPQFVQLD